MENNNLLLTVTLVILGVALFSPSLTGNYQYGNQCGSPGESFCAPSSTQYQGVVRECVYNPRTGANEWSDPVSCPQGQICVAKQVSGTYGSRSGNVNRAECIWPHLPLQY